MRSGQKPLIKNRNPLLQTPTFLQTDEFAAPGILAVWYRLFAPTPPVGRLVNLREREKIRRGRLASIILAVQLIGIELPVIPVVANAPNGHIVIPWLLGCIMALLAAFVFNRRGNLTVAGLLMVVSIEVTIIVKIVTIPGGISIFYLPQFDILVQPLLIAVALLVPWSAFAVAAFNIIFILAALTIGPHAPDLTQVLHNPTQVGDLFAVPVMAQILTSFFGWIIVKNLLDALKQVDQAEQIASLEFALAEDRRHAAERSAQLEEGVTAIVIAIQQVSSKERSARVILPHEHVLWPIGKQIDLFLERYQNALTAQAELEKTKMAIMEFANEIYQSKQQGRQVRVPPRKDTPLDALIMALTGERRPSGSTSLTHSEWDNERQQR